MSGRRSLRACVSPRPGPYVALAGRVVHRAEKSSAKGAYVITTLTTPTKGGGARLARVRGACVGAWVRERAAGNLA